MIRIGKVSNINTANRTARVMFDDVGIVSDWLKVIKSPPLTTKTAYSSGGTGVASFASHKHDIVQTPWMPGIGDTVLCLYDDSFNGDGYILGGM